MSEWQTIDSCPKDGRVLLWHEGIYKVPHIGWWNYADEGFEWVEVFKDSKQAYVAPTHWCRLPEPPTRNNSVDPL